MTVKMFFFSHNREGFSQKELGKLKSTHMYKPFEEFPKELQEIFKSIGEIALKGIEGGRLIFESSEVSGMEDCGLLHKLPDKQPPPLSDKEPKSQFCFIHLSVQEFFAAKYLVDTKTDKGIEEFVRKHINDSTWQVVLQFLAGLLKSSSTESFIKLLPKSTERITIFESSKVEKLTSWPATEDKHLAVQVCKCLYEINDEQQPLLQSKIEEIGLNAVDFRFGLLTPIDLAALLHLLENSAILYIDLSNSLLGDLDAKEVTKFIVNRECKLKWLKLSDNIFTDQAAKDFASTLKHSKCNLESLDLCGNNFTDEAAEDLAAALKHSNCKLEYLNVIENNFTDKAAGDFAAALKHSNCKLKWLNLSVSNFTDKAAEDVAAALMHSNCKLESLDFRGNNFTEKAAKNLAAALLHSNCKLKTLHLRGNNFTKEGRQYLANAGKHGNPKVYFIRDY